MASSTRIPITMIIPNNDKTLIVTPNFPARINIPKKEMGNPKATQKAKEGRRNMDKNIITKMIPTPPFSISN